MKNSSIIIIPLLLLVLGLTSCSTLSEKECREISWFEQGKADVLSRKSWVENIADYKKTCSEYDLAVNEQNYADGVRYAGKVMCTNDQFFHEGEWQRVGKRDAQEGKTRGNIGSYLATCVTYNVEPDSNTYNQGFSEGLKYFCTFENGIRFGSRGGDYINTCPEQLERSFLKGYLIGTKEYHANQLNDQASAARKAAGSLGDEVESKRTEVSELETRLNSFDWDNRDRVDSLNGRIQEIQSEISQAHSEGDINRVTDLQSELSSVFSDRSSLEQELASQKSTLQMELEEARGALRSLDSEHLASLNKANIMEAKARKAVYQAKVFRESNLN